MNRAPSLDAWSKASTFIIMRLTPPLLHGDEEHKEWLRSELEKWIPDLAELIDAEHEK